MVDYDYCIVGAGPIGSYLAKLLSSDGYNVGVFEEHEQVGRPVHCTGLVTSKIKTILPMREEFFLNEIKRVALNSKSNTAYLNNSEYVVDREKFELFLENEAVNSGAKYYKSYSLVNSKECLGANSLLFNTKSGVKSVSASTIIGCDGASSEVNELFFHNKTKYFFGKQFVVKTNLENSSCYNVYFSREFSEFCAWLVPTSKDTAKLGLASINHSIVNSNLDKLYSQVIRHGEILETQAGLIPVYDPYRLIYKKIGKNTLYLMGDAASLVKATSGGGIYHGLLAIKESYKDIVRGVTPRFPKTRMELLGHLLVRNVLSRLSDTDYDEIIRDASSNAVRRVVEESNREDALKIVFKSIMKNPLLLKYAKHLPKLFSNV